MLSDDNICTYMSQCITEGGVADIYVEVIHEGSDDDEDDDESNYEYELKEEESDDEIQVINVPISLVSSSKLAQKKDVSGSGDKSNDKNKSDKTNKGRQKVCEANKGGKESDGSDGFHGDVDTSEDDEEARENRSNASLVKKNVKGVDEVCQTRVVTTHHVKNTPIDDDVDAGNDTPCFDSSKKHLMMRRMDLKSLGEDGRANFPIFDNKATIPIFSIGMRFSGRNEFKEAVVIWASNEETYNIPQG